jgi:putative hydrolase of the HAD superfamily
MSIRGIFFDLYGTLLVYGDMQAAWSDWLSAFYACFQKHGLSISRDEFSRCCDRFFDKEEPPQHQDGLTVFERRIKALGIELGTEMAPEQTSIIANTTADAWQKYVTLDREALPVLKSLNAHKILGLITNFDHPPYVYKILSKYGLNSLFQKIIISAEVGFKKPDPIIFSIALEGTSLQSNEIIYIGDTEEDVRGAMAANAKPILIQREKTWTDNSALDYTIVDTKSSSLSNIIMQNKVSVITKLSELIAMF